MDERVRVLSSLEQTLRRIEGGELSERSSAPPKPHSSRPDKPPHDDGDPAEASYPVTSFLRGVETDVR